jgi:hypothetical protein
MRRIAVFAVAALVLASCGKPEEKTVVVNDKGDKVAVSANGNHMSMQSGDGKTSITIDSNGVTDLKMPAFVTLFPGAKVTATVNGMGTDNTGGTVTFETSAAAADVIAFYKKDSEGAGLKEKMSMNQGGVSMFTSSSDDNKRNLEVVASAGQSAGGTHAQVTWTGK